MRRQDSRDWGSTDGSLPQDYDETFETGSHSVDKPKKPSKRRKKPPILKRAIDGYLAPGETNSPIKNFDYRERLHALCLPRKMFGWIAVAYILVALMVFAPIVLWLTGAPPIAILVVFAITFLALLLDGFLALRRAYVYKNRYIEFGDGWFTYLEPKNRWLFLKGDGAAMPVSHIISVDEVTQSTVRQWFFKRCWYVSADIHGSGDELLNDLKWAVDGPRLRDAIVKNKNMFGGGMISPTS